ncbi:MAG: hypothetical protein ACREOD_02460 [Candidatus Dormibacteria bacterium]
MIRRGCLRNLLGCLVPVVVVLAVAAWAVHLWTTPPTLPRVQPAPPGTLELSEAQAVATALAAGEPVALLHLSDSEATGLLQESLDSYAGLSSLEVHMLHGRVVVSGETSILNHTLVISGPVRLRGQGTATVRLDFTGLAIGQMGLPSAIPQLISRGFHPSLQLPLVGGGRALTFACDAVHRDELIIGVSYGPGRPAAGASACRASR